MKIANYTEDDFIHNGVEVYYTENNEPKSWGYDPVEPSDVWLKGGVYYIDNGCYVYEYDAKIVNRIVPYELYYTEEDGYIYVFGEELVIEEEE